ncbi:MAG: ester cyclase [Caldilineaceae bacterium]
MSIEANKALVRRYYEDAPYHPEVCDEIFAPQIRWQPIQHITLNHSNAVSTPEDEKAAYAWNKAVWGNWPETIDEMIAEGDQVMVRWTFCGAQQGEFFGLPPTNKSVTYAGITIFRIVAGKITEIQNIADRLWMWQQLGVLPETKNFIAQARTAMTTQ